MSADDLPLLTAGNALFQVSHAALNVAAKHILLVNLSFAAGDDLVADAGEQASHSLASVVRLREFENHSNTIEHLRQHFWDVAWSGLFNLGARFL